MHPFIDRESCRRFVDLLLLNGSLSFITYFLGDRPGLKQELGSNDNLVP